jgi:hypothetical protein
MGPKEEEEEEEGKPKISTPFNVDCHFFPLMCCLSLSIII